MGFGAIKTAHTRVQVSTAGACPILLGYIQLQIAEVTSRIVAEKMQEAGQEWDRNISYGVHVLREYVHHLADLGYRPKDMPPFNLHPPPEWRMPGEPFGHGDERIQRRVARRRAKKTARRTVIIFPLLLRQIYFTFDNCNSHIYVYVVFYNYYILYFAYVNVVEFLFL